MNEYVGTDLTESPANLGYQTDLPARLTKHQTVLDLQLDGTNESFALYSQEDGQENFALDSINYEEMGRPSKITVTVRPGDRLNG